MLQAVISKDIRALIAPNMAPFASKATVDVVQAPVGVLPQTASDRWRTAAPVVSFFAFVIGGGLLGLLLYKVVRK